MLAEFSVLRQQARLKRFDRGTGFSSHDSEGDVMATATQSAHSKELDTEQRSSTSRHFEEELRRRVVGQNEAVEALVAFMRDFSQRHG